MGLPGLFRGGQETLVDQPVDDRLVHEHRELAPSERQCHGSELQAFVGVGIELARPGLDQGREVASRQVATQVPPVAASLERAVGEGRTQCHDRVERVTSREIPDGEPERRVDPTPEKGLGDGGRIRFRQRRQVDEDGLPGLPERDDRSAGALPFSRVNATRASPWPTSCPISAAVASSSTCASSTARSSGRPSARRRRTRRSEASMPVGSVDDWAGSRWETAP